MCNGQSLITSNCRGLQPSKHHQQQNHDGRTIGSTTGAALPHPPSLLPAIDARTPAIVSPASLRQQPSERRFLPARWGGSSANTLHLQISSPLASVASPLLPAPTDIDYIYPKRRGDGKYFVSFASYLTQNSPGDVRRDGVCCSSADPSSQNCGGLATPPLANRYQS